MRHSFCPRKYTTLSCHGGWCQPTCVLSLEALAWACSMACILVFGMRCACGFQSVLLSHQCRSGLWMSYTLVLVGLSQSLLLVYITNQLAITNAFGGPAKIFPPLTNWYRATTPSSFNSCWSSSPACGLVVLLHLVFNELTNVSSNLWSSITSRCTGNTATFLKTSQKLENTRSADGMAYLSQAMSNCCIVLLGTVM